MIIHTSYRTIPSIILELFSKFPMFCKSYLKFLRSQITTKYEEQGKYVYCNLSEYFSLRSSNFKPYSTKMVNTVLFSASQNFDISVCCRYTYFLVSNSAFSFAFLPIFLNWALYYGYNMCNHTKYRLYCHVYDIITTLVGPSQIHHSKNSETVIRWMSSLKYNCASTLHLNVKVYINYRLFFCKHKKTFYYH